MNNELFEKCCGEMAEANGLIYYPVRHHSPACARHFKQLAERFRPDCILIEGPSDGSFLIPYLGSENVIPPVCIYSSYSDRLGTVGEPGEKYRAYYPFLSYSPEYAAVKYAVSEHITAQFVDMPYALQLSHFPPESTVKDVSGSETAEYYRRTAEKSGCRNFSEFWESSFETNFQTDNREFIRSVFMLGIYMRELSAPDEECKYRECYMRDKIADAKKKFKRIIVVTGAYHVRGLFTDSDTFKFKSYIAKDSELYLMPYTFAETDSRSGYGAGIPFPAFYSDVWKLMESGDSEPYTSAVLDYIVKTARYARDKQPVSLPDEAQSYYMAKELARLRGRCQPGAFELIDGVRSAFVKGDINTTAAFELDYLYRRMTGLGTGEINITPKNGEEERIIIPPCVLDFRAQCKKFRINIGTIAEQDITLDVVKNKNHYNKSCFLHRMAYLDTGFCKMDSGPDYVTGKNKNLVREHWRVRNGTSVQTRLVDLSVYGDTVENLCREVIRISFGKIQSAEEVGKFLLSTYMTGFSTQISGYLTDAAGKIRDDSDFISQSCFMAYSDRLLNLQRLTFGEYDEDILNLLKISYAAAVNKIGDAAAVTGERVNEIALSLRAMYARCTDFPVQCPQDALMYEIKKTAENRSCSSQIYGVMTALLSKTGAISEEEYCDIISGYMLSAESGNAAEFLYGVILTGRDILFTSDKVLSSVDGAVSRMNDEEFMAALPKLRRAFTSFLPAETVRIARRLTILHGIKADRLTGSVSFTAEEIIAAGNADKAAAAVMKTWGLDTFDTLTISGKEAAENV
ncbi:MAG: hypothetical protein IJY19_06555 [Ruminococcus sp.]|nr:hypothetical protein [Ruminococcus sp.]